MMLYLGNFSFLVSPVAHQPLDLFWVSLVFFYCGEMECGQQSWCWFDQVRARLKPESISGCRDSVLIIHIHGAGRVSWPC